MTPQQARHGSRSFSGLRIDVDGHDPAVVDGEADHGGRAAADRQHARHAVDVDDRRPRAAPPFGQRARSRARRARRPRAACARRSRCPPPSAVKTTSGCSSASRRSRSPSRAACAEGLDHARAAARAWPGSAGAAPRPRGGPARPAGARPAGVASSDGGDLLEVVAEDVVQHERDALGGREALEHDQQREAEVLGDARALGGAGLFDDRLGQPRADVGLAPHARGAQRVQRQPRDRGGQPALEVADLVGVDALQPQPRLLDDVLGLGEAAELAVGEPQQAGAQRLEALGERLWSRRLQPLVEGHAAAPRARVRQPAGAQRAGHRERAPGRRASPSRAASGAPARAR